MEKNIWGLNECNLPNGGTCWACCIAPYDETLESVQMCEDLDHSLSRGHCGIHPDRLGTCRRFHCGNPRVTDEIKERLRQIANRYCL
ncbi:hypothetical protein GF362_00060 [Candidatus Dojkabacteria bacterium]|nr:hypothetical protein [Candidatus Dojkabacteria bacterium]